MRIRLTTAKSNIRYLFLFFSVATLGTIIAFAVEKMPLRIAEIIALLFMLLFPFTFFILFKVIKKGGYMEFDQSYLYKVENQSEEKIALSSIYEIERPIFQTDNNTKNWTIRYTDEKENKKELRFSVAFYGENFSRFIALVKQTNNKLRIKR